MWNFIITIISACIVAVIARIVSNSLKDTTYNDIKFIFSRFYNINFKKKTFLTVEVIDSKGDAVGNKRIRLFNLKRNKHIYFLRVVAKKTRRKIKNRIKKIKKVKEASRELNIREKNKELNK